MLSLMAEMNFLMARISMAKILTSMANAYGGNHSGMAKTPMEFVHVGGSWHIAAYFPATPPLVTFRRNGKRN